MHLKPSMPEHTCNLSAQEAEAGNQELWGQSGLHIDFGACHKQNTTQTKTLGMKTLGQLVTAALKAVHGV